MRLSRRGTSGLLAGALILLPLLAGLSRTVPHRVRVPVELQPGAGYAVPVTAGNAEFPLPLRPGTRALLIISSLAPHQSVVEVTVSARQRQTTGAPLPMRRLGPLRIGPHDPEPDDLPTGTATHSGEESRARATGDPPSIPVSAEHDAGRTLTVRSSDVRPPAESDDRTAADSDVPRRTFDIHVTSGPLDDPDQFVRLAAEEVGRGRHVRVYLDEQIAEDQLAPGLVDALVHSLDERVLPAVSQRLGPIRDVDGDGTLTVLLTPWLSQLQGGRTSLDGFVRTSDFRTELPRPLSNQCDMLYLNSNLVPGAHLETLLTHELTHAIAAGLRAPGGLTTGGLPLEEDWLNEGLAHVMESLAEERSWSNLDYRIARYLEDPRRSPLVVPDYHAADRWRDHGCRGATFLFLRWCVSQFGDRLPHRLIHGSTVGRRNLEQATGHTFEELYRRWTIALASSRVRADGAMRGPTDIPQSGTCGDGDGLSLHERIGRFKLSGPRFESVGLDAAPFRTTLRGTTTTFVELSASHLIDGSGRLPTTVSVQSSAAAGLQVTLMILPSASRTKHTPSDRDSGQGGQAPAVAAAPR